MVVVTMVEVDTVVMNGVLCVGVLTNVDVVAVGVIAIVLTFALTESCSVYVSSGITIDSFVEALAGVMLDVLSEIGVEELADVNTFAFRMTALEFPVPIPLEELSRPLALLDCARVLQAWMPSYHVWRSLKLPGLPQFLNQEPPRPQQLLLPDFPMMPHLGHTELMVVVVTACIKAHGGKRENNH